MDSEGTKKQMNCPRCGAGLIEGKVRKEEDGTVLISRIKKTSGRV